VDRRRDQPGWEAALAGQLAAGRLPSDARFDRLFGERLVPLSGLHFTPVAVAARAAAWLTEAGATEVADLGAGAGKFCLVGAALTGAAFTGLELRPGLVEVARAAARRLGLANARFVEADVLSAPLRRHQAFYVCNPFAEGEAEPDEWLDPALPAADKEKAAAALAARLATLPPGTRVAVHCGLGAPMPAGFRLVSSEPIGRRGALLECWVQGAATPGRAAPGRPRR
jgi:SAM-dependent methyltransferase